MSFTIHSKYKYFDSTVQRAENRWQKFHFCRLPFAVNVMLNVSIDRCITGEERRENGTTEASGRLVLKQKNMDYNFVFEVSPLCTLGLCYRRLCLNAKINARN